MAKTRKHTKSSMTIPQLRKAFDHIEGYANSLVRRESDVKKCRKAFQQEWMRVFHRSLDDKAADAYLHFEAKKGKRKGTRKMKGGAALAGAPLDYSTRPGIYGVYGEFPEYISSGFSFGNSINKMAIQEGCNSAAEAAKFQAPYTGFGAPSLAGQKGGKGKKHAKKGTRKMKGGAPNLAEFAAAASFRPLDSSNPVTSMYQGMMEMKGVAPYPSAMANTGTPPYVASKPSVIAPSVGAINRDLMEVRA